MSWLSDLGGYVDRQWGTGGPFGAATKAVERNRNAIGDVVKYGSDLLAPFTGPFAPLVAGAGNALGTGIHEGTNFGDIAKSGAIGGAIGYGENALGSAFGAGSGAASGGSGLGSALESAGDVGRDVDGAFEVGSSAGNALADSGAKVAQGLATNAPTSLGQQVLNKVNDVGSWAAKHSETVGKAFSAIGDAPMNEARAKQMALQNQLYQQQLDRQKSLDPLRQALAGRMAQFAAQPPQNVTVRPNPYT